MKETVAHAYKTNGLRGVIEAASCNDGDQVYAWELAMMAWYGPVGLHPSYEDKNGRPTAEARERFPEIDWRMRDAEAKLIAFLGVSR